ncbi:unnamed protein product [Somion occarium]|uniref:enoyl-[acyl-carrier-protein] reductase n=1 Tax=Somion occarium TaxID=3059160 RepID=A0ABP1E617_9APHY
MLPSIRCRRTNLIRRPCLSARLSTSSVLLANRAIVYSSFGNPSEVLSAITYPDLPPPPSKSLNVKYILSPINPADLNVIENKYHSKPSPVSSLSEGRHKFPEPHYVGGNEGLAEVTEVGPDVTHYKVGDRVVLTKQQSGTWASARTLHEDDVLKIPVGLSEVNPPTAYNMLHSFVEPKEGDLVMQNGANSAVGQAVIQIAARKGIRTLNFVRNRPDIDSLKNYLQSLGATHVFTYDDLKDKETVQNIKTTITKKGTSLMLNCVSGEPTKDMTRLLADSATLVSYGAMSKQPLILPTSLFIFRDLRCRGFWQSKWYEEHSIQQREELMKTLAELKLREPEYEILNLKGTASDEEVAQQVRSVIAKIQEGRYGRKVLLRFEPAQ